MCMPSLKHGPGLGAVAVPFHDASVVGVVCAFYFLILFVLGATSGRVWGVLLTLS